MGQEKAKYFATSDQSLYKRTLLGSDYELVDHVILNSNSYKQKAKKKTEYLHRWCLYKREGITVCNRTEFQWVPSFKFAALQIIWQIYLIAFNTNLEFSKHRLAEQL